MRRLLLAVLAGAALIAATATEARAQPAERVTLRWEAPEGCPAASRVSAEVERLLGPHGARPPKPLDVTARVAEDPAGGFRVHLEASGEGGPREREIKGVSCAAIADATALIIALMIDPAAVAAAPPPAPPPPPPPPSPPPPPPSPPPLPPPPPAPSPPAPSPPPRASGLRPSFRLQAWAGADLGTLPSVAFAAGGTAGVVLGPVRIEIGAGAWPAKAAVVVPRLDIGGDVSLLAGFAQVCFHAVTATPRRPFEIGPCAGYEVGRLHATGFGVTSPSEGNALWSAARAGGLFTWAPIRRLALVFRLEAAFPLQRPTFVLGNVGTVHQPSAAAGRALGGVELRL